MRGTERDKTIKEERDENKGGETTRKQFSPEKTREEEAEMQLKPNCGVVISLCKRAEECNQSQT